MLNLNLIVAMGIENKVIGDEKGNLPFKLKGDLSYFKEKTLGNIVIMGRKTYESLPILLKDRQQIILTSDCSYNLKNGDNGLIVNNIDNLSDFLTDDFINGREIFVMGGSEIYNYFLKNNLIINLYITEVHGTFSGNKYFPDYDESIFKEVYCIPKEEREIYYEFKKYERIK